MLPLIHYCNSSTHSFQKCSLMRVACPAWRCRGHSGCGARTVTSPAFGWSSPTDTTRHQPPRAKGPLSAPSPPFWYRRIDSSLPRRGPVSVLGQGTRCVVPSFHWSIKSIRLLSEAIRRTFNSVNQQASVCLVVLGKPWASPLGTE